LAEACLSVCQSVCSLYVCLPVVCYDRALWLNGARYETHLGSRYRTFRIRKTISSWMTLKATKVKIEHSIVTVAPIGPKCLQQNQVIGHLYIFDDLDLQENRFGAMSRPSQQQLDFLSNLASVSASRASSLSRAAMSSA
jgi:hypothetical protein